MEKPTLRNPEEYPTDEVLAKHLGDAKNTFDSFLQLIKNEHPTFSTEWRYYNDGK